MKRALWPIVSLVIAVGCSSTPPLLRVQAASKGADLRLTLIGDAGIRINARLKPALELQDGTVLRFDSPQLTPDSSYFIAPPEALLLRFRGPVHGRLRASICSQSEGACRVVTLRI